MVLMGSSIKSQCPPTLCADPSPHPHIVLSVVRQVLVQIRQGVRVRAESIVHRTQLIADNKQCTSTKTHGEVDMGSRARGRMGMGWGGGRAGDVIAL